MDRFWPGHSKMSRLKNLWITRICILASFSWLRSFAQLESNGIQEDRPQITSVSAMCTEDGITAQIMFDSAFDGKIYSHKYSQTHECVYFNSYGEPMILFTIPNYMCGTRLSRNGQNIVNHIENEVYVQFDKDTQNVEDKRYLFICDLSFTPPSDFSGTIAPQTIVVQTIEPTRIFVTQSGVGLTPPNVVMSIQEGEGPFQLPVSRALKLGDSVTLVVKSTDISETQDYRMFVHSCFAADGTAENKVELIDRAGCNVRPKVVGRLQRTRSALGEVIYYAKMQAFKFPSSDDVYFSCNVDICGSCNFAEICPNENRQRRSLMHNRIQHANMSHGNGDQSYENLEINEIQLHDYIRILDEEDLMSELASQRQAKQANDYCFSPLAMAGIMATFGCLSLVLIILTIFIISIVHRRSKSSHAATNGRSEDNILRQSQYSPSLPSTTASSRRQFLDGSGNMNFSLGNRISRWNSLRGLYNSMWNNYDSNHRSSSNANSSDFNSRGKSSSRPKTATTSMTSRDLR